MRTSVKARWTLGDLDDGRVVFQQLLRLAVASELHVNRIAIHLGDLAATEDLVIDLIVDGERERGT